MADVRDLGGASLLFDVVNLSWGVIGSHLSEAELPVGFVVLGEGLVTWGMFSSSLVSKPNIITSVDELESWGDIWVVHDPAVCGVSDTVLQEDDWSIFLGLLARSDSEDVQDVTILSGNWVRLKNEAILSDDLLEGFVDVWADLEVILIWLLDHQLLLLIIILKESDSEKVHEIGSFKEEMLE